MVGRKLISMAVLSIVAMGLSGCFSSNPKDISAFLRPYDVEVTAEQYILRPPDEIQVRSSSVPEIDEQLQRIRPDGMVSFERIGEIEAAGKTCAQVADLLKAKASKLYNLTGDYPIDVRVEVYRSKVYYMLGQVTYPGPVPCSGRDTLLTSLAKAQPTVLAWKSRIQVIRPSRDENVRPKIFQVNYGRMIAHGDISKDVLLQEGDVVYVPPTVLAAIAMKIEEFVRPIGRVFSTAYYMQRAESGGGY